MSPLETREVTTAEGKKIACPYLGPVKVKIPNCDYFTGVLALGDSVLLGAIPIRDMDLVIHLTTGTLTVNPRVRISHRGR